MLHMCFSFRNLRVIIKLLYRLREMAQTLRCCNVSYATTMVGYIYSRFVERFEDDPNSGFIKTHKMDTRKESQ